MPESAAAPAGAEETPSPADEIVDAHPAHPAPGEAHDDALAAAADVLPEERPLGPPRRRVAIGGGVTVSCVDHGEGPPVLLLHGFPTSAALWRRTIAHLAPAHRCIAPDLLGFGETDGPVDSDFGIEAQAARALALLDALGVAGEVAVVGHDWGGSVAQALVARAPERVSHLVLVDCPAFEADPPPVVRRIARLARRPFLWDLAADTGLLLWFAKGAGGLRAGAVEPESIEDAAIEEYMRPLVKDTPPAYRSARERMRRAIVETLDGLDAALDRAAGALARFEKPTLVVWGCDDPYVSLSWGKRLADTIPGCVGFELLPFCGHWVPEERAEDLASLITAHLDGGARASAIADALHAAIPGGAAPLIPPPPEATPRSPAAPAPASEPADAALEALLGGERAGPSGRDGP